MRSDNDAIKAKAGCYPNGGQPAFQDFGSKRQLNSPTGIYFQGFLNTFHGFLQIFHF